MSKFRSFFGNALAGLYFILVMWWIILILAFVPIGIFSDIQVVRESGFSTSDYAMSFIGVFGLFIGLSLLIPPFRKIYDKLPWLFPYVKIFYLDVIIMGVAITILNYGYEVQNTTRHTIFFLLMLVQIIVCRLAMCIYFNKKSVKHIRGGGSN